MMDFTTLLTNTQTLANQTTADPTVVAAKVAAELKPFEDRNNAYDSMKAGLIAGNQAKDDAAADALLLGMGIVKTDLKAKEAELKARIQAEEDAKAEQKFYNLAEKAARFEASLNAISQQNQPAPVETDLDKLIKLQTIQLQAQMEKQQKLVQENNELSIILQQFAKGFEDGVNEAVAKIEEAAAKQEEPKPAPAPSYYRPSNREQYEAHKSITKSKSAERGQLYADMKAGRITLGQYMAGCASTWSDAAAEHADVTARRRGYYI